MGGRSGSLDSLSTKIKKFKLLKSFLFKKNRLCLPISLEYIGRRTPVILRRISKIIQNIALNCNKILFRGQR